jgi:hypothetical protein
MNLVRLGWLDMAAFLSMGLLLSMVEGPLRGGSRRLSGLDSPVGGNPRLGP